MSRECVLTFFHTTGAIAAEQALLAAGIPVRVMPMPDAITAGCGICLRVDPACRAMALALVGKDVQGVYLRKDGAYRLIDPPVFNDALGLGLGDAVSLVGCGGKTSLMFSLAQENRKNSVLLSTTTHIFMPPDALYDRAIEPGDALFPGVNLLHGGEIGEGKVKGPPVDALSAYAAPNALILLEADGSKQLPTKAWAAHEPVIPSFTTATIGVLTLWPVGLPLSDRTTHRVPLFEAMTGARAGEPLTLPMIASMVSHPDGLFGKAIGRKILFINQVESDEPWDMAAELAALLPKRGLDRIACGSVFENSCSILWKEDA